VFVNRPNRTCFGEPALASFHLPHISTFREFSNAEVSAPYPTVEGVAVLLKTLEKAQPKARETKPEDYLDARLVREIDKSGFIDRL
jgi:hypothetical protein